MSLWLFCVIEYKYLNRYLKNEKDFKVKNGTKNPGQGFLKILSKHAGTGVRLYKDDKSFVKRVKIWNSLLFNKLYFKYFYILIENMFGVNGIVIDFFNNIYQNVSEKGEARTLCELFYLLQMKALSKFDFANIM